MRAALLGVVALLRAAGSAAATAALEPVPFPPMTEMEPAVRAQLEGVKRQVDEAPTATSFGACGQAYLVYDLVDPAAACLRNAERLDPREPRWPYYLGRVAAARGELAVAAEAFERARALAPAAPAPLLRLAETALARGNTAEARTAYTSASRIPAAAAAAAYGLGLVALQDGDADAAATHLRAALALAPQAGAVRHALATALRRQGRVEEATRVLPAGPGEPPAIPDPWSAELAPLDRGGRGHLGRGTELLAAGRIAEAEAELRQAVEAQPQSATAWQNLAAARERRGDLAGARAAYERAVELSPDAAVALGNLAALLLGQGERAQGIAMLEHALAVAPDAVQIQYNLAVALLEGGEGGRALALLDAVLRRRPDDVEARYYRGLALLDEGRAAEAAAALRQVADLAPKEAAPRLAEARALLAAGDETSARQRLEKARADLPGDEPIALELIRVLASASAPAARDGQRAWALAGDLLARGANAQREAAAAMALAELGRFAEAIDHQSRAVELAGERPDEAATLRLHLRCYEAGKPLRQPWSTRGATPGSG
jgi:tetratricopeptide (TPR) repeat protein